MTVSPLDRAADGSSGGLLGSAGERRQPTHGRQAKRRGQPARLMWLAQLGKSPTSPTARAGTFAIFIKTINALSAGALNSRIDDHDAR